MLRPGPFEQSRVTILVLIQETNDSIDDKQSKEALI
jgi:hypothetical protein